MNKLNLPNTTPKEELEESEKSFQEAIKRNEACREELQAARAEMDFTDPESRERFVQRVAEITEKYYPSN